MIRKALTVLFIFGFSFSLLGRFGVASNVSAQPIEEMHYGGVPYISGGIGLDEREQLETMGRNYDLKLVFAVQQGNYLSNVNVAIKGSSGKVVLEGVSNGPWFYADLPTGTYRISATAMGKTITKTAGVTEGRRTMLNFLWR